MTNTHASQKTQDPSIIPETALALRHDSSQQKIGRPAYRAPLNIFAFDDRYEIHADVPGSSSDQIDVTLNDGVLRIEAAVPDRQPAAQLLRSEFGVGNFWREIRLGEDIDTEQVTSSYRAGVLKLVLPKRPDRKVRRIEIH